MWTAMPILLPFLPLNGHITTGCQTTVPAGPHREHGPKHIICTSQQDYNKAVSIHRVVLGTLTPNHCHRLGLDSLFTDGTEADKPGANSEAQRTQLCPRGSTTLQFTNQSTLRHQVWSDLYKAKAVDTAAAQA